MRSSLDGSRFAFVLIFLVYNCGLGLGLEIGAFYESGMKTT